MTDSPRTPASPRAPLSADALALVLAGLTAIAALSGLLPAIPW